jgi:membrane-associated protease RseP (regulator of RpoE activity)
MTGPKHLWSGDWERESEAVKARPDPDESPPAATAPLEAATTPAEPPAHKRALSAPVVISVALILIVGTAVGLNALLSGGKKTPHRQTSAQTGRPGTAPQAPTATVPQLTMPQAAPPQQAPPPSTTPQPTTPATPTPSTDVVYWSGMQIETISPGEVMIATVRLGSPADRAGLNPGEQLIAVNGHQLNTASDIGPAVKGLRAGRVITLEIVNGAAGPEPVSLALGASPSSHP